jgi:hypothetical protein
MSAGAPPSGTAAPATAGAPLVAPSPSQPLPSLPAGFSVDVVSFSKARLHRVYWKGANPLMPRVKGHNRYDCPSYVPAADEFGVLYLGEELETCWLETVVRDALVRPAGAPIPIPAAKMTDRWACEVHVAGPLKLATFRDESLLFLGESASNIMGDKYLRTQEWARLLHAHGKPKVDGLQYRSRFKSNELCVALFDRGIKNGKLTVSNQRSLDPASSLEMQAVIKHFNVRVV